MLGLYEALKSVLINILSSAVFVAVQTAEVVLFVAAIFDPDLVSVSPSESSEVMEDNGPFTWQKGTPRTRYRAMDDRREALQEEMQAVIHDDSNLDGLVEEWMALVVARDIAMKEFIQAENSAVKNEKLTKLHEILQELTNDRFVFDENERHLHEQLVTLHNTIKAYSTIIPGLNQCMNSKKEKETVIKAPPPPPPPMPPPSFTHKKEDKISMSPQRPQNKIVDDDENVLPNLHINKFQTPVRHRTPLKSIDSNGPNFMQIINGFGRKNLKSTPFPRSPGGTPARRAPRYNACGGGDLIASALRTKFRNVLTPLGSDRSPGRSVESPW